MAQKMTDTQLLHKANGIRRIKQAIKNCDLPVSEVGTVFNNNHLKLLDSYSCSIQVDISNLDAESLSALWQLANY